MVIGKFGKAMKNSAISMGLKAFLNDRFGKYGEVLDLSLDTEQSKIVAHAMLRGEKEPLTINIDRYKLLQEDGKTFLTIEEVSTTREWITTLLNRVLDGRRVELPSGVRHFL